MSFDLQKHNVAVHASRLTPEFRKAIHSESGISHLKHVKSLRQLNEHPFPQVQGVSSKDDGLLISDSRIYALKKRLLAPSWWVEGVLLSLGSKEAWFDSLMAKRAGKLIAAPSNINTKNITLMFAIWHEALSHIFSLKNDEMILRFQINKYLIGTQKDVLDTCKQLENIWATPLNLFEVKPSKKARSLSLSRAGSLGFIQHAQIENDVDGIWFSLSLSQSLQSFYCPQKINQDTSSLKASFISINPVVIQSMGRKASVKKILNYLFLEFSKQESSNHQVNNWSSIPIESKNISSFHKEILVNVPALYDHGVLGWNIAAPNVKLSELKNKLFENSYNDINSSLGSIVYCWQLSDQAKEASELEQAISEKLMTISPNFFNLQQVPPSIPLSKIVVKAASGSGVTLFPEPPPDQLKKARKEKALKAEKAEKVDKIEKKLEKKLEKKVYIPKDDPVVKKTSKKIMSQTLFDSSDTLFHDIPVINNKKEIIKKKIVSVKEALSDNDFIVLVSEFYESLKPLQKKAFERERAGMTTDQFRVYMTPILKRKKIRK
jgi:hypothetical protein